MTPTLFLSRGYRVSADTYNIPKRLYVLHACELLSDEALVVSALVGDFCNEFATRLWIEDGSMLTTQVLNGYYFVLVIHRNLA